MYYCLCASIADMHVGGKEVDSVVMLHSTRIVVLFILLKITNVLHVQLIAVDHDFDASF